MENEDIKTISDEELVEISGSVTVGTPSGLKAQKAQAELMRRNTEALNKSSETSERYSKVMLALTYVIIMISVGQFLFAINDSSNTSDWEKIGQMLLYLAPIALIIYVVDKMVFNKHEK